MTVLASQAWNFLLSTFIEVFLGLSNDKIFLNFFIVNKMMNIEKVNKSYINFGVMCLFEWKMRVKR